MAAQTGDGGGNLRDGEISEMSCGGADLLGGGGSLSSGFLADLLDRILPRSVFHNSTRPVIISLQKDDVLDEQR
jgi:hypothetical protein